MHALSEDVELAAEVSEHGADGDADSVADDRDQQRKRHRDVEAVGQPHEHVAAAIVGAEDVLARRRVRRRSRQVEQRFVRAVRIRRHQHPVPFALRRELRFQRPVVRLADGAQPESDAAWYCAIGKVVLAVVSARRSALLLTSSGRKNETAYATDDRAETSSSRA